ncbi:MAG: hypothetical protein NVS4B2_11470 [Chloroflexota bacterium]
MSCQPGYLGLPVVISGLQKLVESQCRKSVRCYAPGDPLTTVLADMAENRFSQVIVRGSDGLCCVTEEGITQWLAQWVERGKVTLTGVTVADVLEHELEEHFTVMGGAQTYRDALQAFEAAIRNGEPRLYAIILTETGDPMDEPIGFIVPEDLVGYN